MVTTWFGFFRTVRFKYFLSMLDQMAGNINRSLLFSKCSPIAYFSSQFKPSLKQSRSPWKDGLHKNHVLRAFV